MIALHRLIRVADKITSGHTLAKQLVILMAPTDNGCAVRIQSAPQLICTDNFSAYRSFYLSPRLEDVVALPLKRATLSLLLPLRNDVNACKSIVVARTRSTFEWTSWAATSRG